MKKVLSFFNRLKPGTIDLAVSPQQIKTQILQVALLISTLYGSMHLHQILRAEEPNSNSFFIAGLLFFTICSAAFFFLMRLSLRVKLSAFLVLVFLHAQALFFDSGWSTLCLSFLLIFSLLGTLTTQRRAGNTCLTLTVISLVVWMVYSAGLNPDSAQKVTLEGITALLSFGMLHVLMRLLLRKLEAAAPQESQPAAIHGKIQTRELSGSADVSADLLELLASEGDAHQGVKSVVEMICRLPGAYFAGVYQTDRAREYAVLLHGSGDEGLQMLNASYRLSVGGFSLVGKAIQSGKTQFVITNLEDPSRFENPFLPFSQAEMAFALGRGSVKTGALDVHFSELKEPSVSVQRQLELAASALTVLLERLAEKMTVPTQRSISATTPVDSWNINTFNAEYSNEKVALLENQPSLNLPVMLRHDKIGTLKLMTNGRDLTESQLRFIDNVMAQGLSEIETMRRIEKIKRHTEIDHTIYEISTRLHASADATLMMKSVLQDLCRTLGVQKAQIVLNVPELAREESESATDTHSLINKPTTGPLSEG